jgi:cytochrome c553
MNRVKDIIRRAVLSLCFGLIGFLALTGPGLMAAGSAERGASISLTCAACHGATGISANPEWPNLAGQHEKYTVQTLKAYQSGDRQDVLMTGQAMSLSGQDIADLAAYFEGEQGAQNTADPALIAAGERLYRGGDRDKNISACIACHGPDGRGNRPAAYPSVAGQHASYTAKQLRAYADGTRKSDSNQVMRNIAVLLSEDEINAVSSYIQGLR